MGAIEHVLDPIEMHNVLLKMFHHLGHGQFCSEYRGVGLATGHDDLEWRFSVVYLFLSGSLHVLCLFPFMFLCAYFICFSITALY